MFFNTWHDLVRLIIVGILAYFALILLLRISGKRTLSKMNAFDLVVTVALGSTLATILLSKDIALLEGIAALALLIGLQFIVSWLAKRSQNIRKVIKAEPTLLFFGGQFLREAMQQERVLEEEVRAAVRDQGIASLDQVAAVVLETDGSVTVIPQAGAETMTALTNVQNYQHTA